MCVTIAMVSDITVKQAIAPYKIQQAADRDRLRTVRYLVIDGIPDPNGPYVLREQYVGKQPTGRRKLVRKDRLPRG